MEIKDPSSIAPATYAWVLVLSLWGGIAHHLRRQKAGLATRNFWLELLCDLTYSSFCGLLTFFLCEASQIAPMQTAAMVGVAGHMGSRLIHAAEILIVRRLSRAEG